MEYTVDFFIKKFEAIPEELWHIGSYKDEHNDKQRCAYGHCGVDGIDIDITDESEALEKIFKPLKFTGDNSNHGFAKIPDINDGKSIEYQQPTPKQRILAALYDIKAMQAVKEAETIINENKIKLTF